MSNEKFTQGEWHYSLSESGGFGFDCFGITSSNGDIVVGGCGCCGSPFGDNINDVYLISAAPDMYRALKKMVDMHIEDFGCAGLDNEVIDEARAALAKADGK